MICGRQVEIETETKLLEMVLQFISKILPKQPHFLKNPAISQSTKMGILLIKS